MDYVNLHVRGGHILVLQQPNLTTTASRMSPFELTVALDENGDANGYLFWDDGQSLDTYENEKYVWINYNLSNVWTHEHTNTYADTLHCMLLTLTNSSNGF
jgi:alpha-glucosidase (family GH31 glycosyl hydrolase)